MRGRALRSMAGLLILLVGCAPSDEVTSGAAVDAAPVWPVGQALFGEYLGSSVALGGYTSLKLREDGRYEFYSVGCEHPGRTERGRWSQEPWGLEFKVEDIDDPLLPDRVPSGRFRSKTSRPEAEPELCAAIWSQWEGETILVPDYLGLRGELDPEWAPVSLAKAEVRARLDWYPTEAGDDHESEGDG